MAAGGSGEIRRIFCAATFRPRLPGERSLRLASDNPRMQPASEAKLPQALRVLLPRRLSGCSLR
jgi:hypothetical protein